MLTHSSQADHRQRVDGLVRRWLDERQTLIAQEAALHAAHAAGADAATLARHVAAFCQTLMDYVSAGYFEVYDELLAEGEAHGKRVQAEGQTLFQRLQPTLDAIIRFNDLYENPEDEAVQASLSRELSGLGLVLEGRFEIEDRMIALLHAPAQTASA